MEKIIFLFSILLFLSPKITTGQLALPKATTTKEKAIKDLMVNITNEGWFFEKTNNGISYNAIFRNTPVGLKHAYSKFYELKKLYGSEKCIDESLMSALVKDADGSIDYEMLSITLKSESSEIRNYCSVNDNKILGFLLNSTDGADCFIILIIQLKN